MADTPDPAAFLLEDKPNQALVAIPRFENGRTVVYYELMDLDAPRKISPERLQHVLSLAGAWSDLDADEVLDSLDRIRRANPPSPPLDLPE